MCVFFRYCFIFCGLFFVHDAFALTIRVDGLSGPMKRNVELALESEKNQRIQSSRAVDLKTFAEKEASLVIQKALRPYGYFHAIVHVQLSQEKGKKLLIFTIQKGPPLCLKQVSISILGEAKQDVSFARLKKHLPVQVGQVFNTEAYEKAKQLLYDLASTRGYFDAKMIESKIYINIKTHQARIVLIFDSGSRYLFGHSLFSDNPFAPSFLKRFLHYKVGGCYHYRDIEKTQHDLISSNYFSQVIVSPLIKKVKNQKVPISIKLIPRKRYAYSLGAGYGTDTGPRGVLGFEVRHLNPHGHQLKTLMQASENNSFVSASYRIPGQHPASDLWALSTGYSNFDQVTGAGKSFKWEGSYTTAIGDWKQTVALTYLNERYNIVRLPFTETEVFYPNVHWQYLSTQDTLYPRQGLSISGFLGGTPRLLSSGNSFFQARADLKLFFTLFGVTRFILRSSLARTEIKALQNLPFSLQLFAGGARSVRGYQYNQIGPGRNLFVASFEIQQRVIGRFYAVGLFDMGNVSDRSPFQRLNKGLGVGVAWRSPVGVFEVTVTNAITQPNKPWVIQFTMGPEL